MNEQRIEPNYELISKLQKKKNAVRKELNKKGKLINGELNTYDNYQYFSEAQYKELFTELFSKNGIELVVDEIDYGTFDGTDKQPFGRTVTLACTLVDIDTGYAETSRHTGEGLDRGDKAGYKATTGALKRFLSSTFLVATQDDPEREDDKPSATKRYSTKPVDKKNSNAIGTITRGQMGLIKTLFKNDVDELKVIMTKYNKKKIEELTIEEASQIIKGKNEEKDNGKPNSK